MLRFLRPNYYLMSIRQDLLSALLALQRSDVLCWVFSKTEASIQRSLPIARQCLRKHFSTSGALDSVWWALNKIARTLNQIDIRVMKIRLALSNFWRALFGPIVMLNNQRNNLLLCSFNVTKTANWPCSKRLSLQLESLIPMPKQCAR